VDFAGLTVFLRNELEVKRYTTNDLQPGLARRLLENVAARLGNRSFL
jgi:hypothetical protein